MNPPCLRSFLVFYTFQRSPLRSGVSEKEENTQKVSSDRQRLCAFDKFTHLPCLKFVLPCTIHFGGVRERKSDVPVISYLDTREFGSSCESNHKGECK